MKIREIFHWLPGFALGAGWQIEQRDGTGRTFLQHCP